MDYVKKIISIEDARTRTQGLMPYFELGKIYPSFDDITTERTVPVLGLETASGDNGNWGQIVANPAFLNGKNYETMLKRYYTLLNDARNGIKLRKVETKDNEVIFTEDIGVFSLDGECFSGGEEPDYIYEYAAYDTNQFYSTENTHKDFLHQKCN